MSLFGGSFFIAPKVLLIDETNKTAANGKQSLDFFANMQYNVKRRW